MNWSYFRTVTMLCVALHAWCLALHHCNIFVKDTSCYIWSNIYAAMHILIINMKVCSIHTNDTESSLVHTYFSFTHVQSLLRICNSCIHTFQSRQEQPPLIYNIFRTSPFNQLLCLFFCSQIQMIVQVYLSHDSGSAVDVPITPETTCQDIIDMCKETGERHCHLAELWRECGR